MNSVRFQDKYIVMNKRVIIFMKGACLLTSSICVSPRIYRVSTIWSNFC